jgi:hypothetical protein
LRNRCIFILRLDKSCASTIVFAFFPGVADSRLVVFGPEAFPLGSKIED